MVINNNLLCLNNVATVILDSISSLPSSQEIPIEHNGAFLGTRRDRNLSDVKARVTKLNTVAHPMRKVTKRTETNDLLVNSEDVIQPLVPPPPLALEPLGRSLRDTLILIGKLKSRI